MLEFFYVVCNKFVDTSMSDGAKEDFVRSGALLLEYRQDSALVAAIALSSVEEVQLPVGFLFETGLGQTERKTMTHHTDSK